MRMNPTSATTNLLIAFTLLLQLTRNENSINAFVIFEKAKFGNTLAQSSSTSLNAIGVLARKAKENEVQKFIDSGEVDSDILSKLQQIQDASSSDSTTNADISEFQKALTKRKGTITVIAEYKRKQDKGAFIDEIYDPDILSPTFREFGAAAIAVMADERMGGCTYNDIELIRDEQTIAIGDVPGPLYLISSDLIVNDIQIAQSAHSGAHAIVVRMDVMGKEKAQQFLQSARTLGLDVIMSVEDTEQAQTAVDIGATILMISASSAKEGFEPGDRCAMLDDVKVPDGVTICKIANIISRDDKGLQEVEDAWICRDKGFQAVWASDFLYKSGNDSIEHPGAIINSMKAKSSVKWASVKARGGKGEGAREYLGDIMM